MKPEELYQKEFGDAESIPKESVVRLLKVFARALNIKERELLISYENKVGHMDRSDAEMFVDEYLNNKTNP